MDITEVELNWWYSIKVFVPERAQGQWVRARVVQIRLRAPYEEESTVDVEIPGGMPWSGRLTVKPHRLHGPGIPDASRYADQEGHA